MYHAVCVDMIVHSLRIVLKFPTKYRN